MKQYRVLYETEANDGKWRTFGGGGITEDLEEAKRWFERNSVYANTRIESREVSAWQREHP